MPYKYSGDNPFTAVFTPSSLPAYKANLRKALAINEQQICKNVYALKPTLIEDRRDWRGVGETFITELRHHAVYGFSLGFEEGDDDPAGRFVAIAVIIPMRAPLLFDVRKLGWNKVEPDLTSILPPNLVDAMRHHDVVGMGHEAFQTHYDFLLPWNLRIKNIVDAKLFLQSTARPTDAGAARRTFYELPNKDTASTRTLPDALDYWAKTAQKPFAACLGRMVRLAESGILEELGKLLVDPASFTVALLDPYALEQECGPNLWHLRFRLKRYRNPVFARELLSDAGTKWASFPPPPPAVREEDAGPSAQSSGDEEEALSLKLPLPEPTLSKEEALSPQPALPQPKSSKDKDEALLPLPKPTLSGGGASLPAKDTALPQYTEKATSPQQLPLPKPTLSGDMEEASLPLPEPSSSGDVKEASSPQLLQPETQETNQGKSNSFGSAAAKSKRIIT